MKSPPRCGDRSGTSSDARRTRLGRWLDRRTERQAPARQRERRLGRRRKGLGRYRWSGARRFLGLRRSSWCAPGLQSRYVIRRNAGAEPQLQSHALQESDSVHRRLSPRGRRPDSEEQLHVCLAVRHGGACHEDPRQPTQARPGCQPPRGNQPLPDALCGNPQGQDV